MKHIKKTITSVLLIAVIAGCSEFDKINTDKNNPSNVTSAMLATDMIENIAQKGFSGNKNFVYDVLLAKQLAWWEGTVDEQYNKIGTQGMFFQVIINGKRMVEKAAPEYEDAYRGLAIFCKVNKMFETSMQLGDIAYSEAGLAEEKAIYAPKYDPQKDVMNGLLNELDEAYNCFTRAQSAFKGDPVYNGDIQKWEKIVTALQLKILIHLSKKENDPDLKVKERFAQAMKKTLMTSNADNFQTRFENKSSMYYPFSTLNGGSQATYAMHSTTIIDTLKKYDDYRLYYYAEPAAGILKQNPALSESDKEAYIGVDPSMSLSDIGNLKAQEKYCRLNKRYTSAEEPFGEPFIRFGYAEQCFIIAEAAARGWINTNEATNYYKKGIEASMKFVSDNTKEKYAHGMPITDSYIQTFINKTEIQLGTDSESNINKIITQKYIDSFLRFSYNAYFDYRRTGYPKLPINPRTSLNDNGYENQLPTRWRYRGAEYSSNNKNLNDALKRQYDGLDENNGIMWILK